MLTFNLPCAIGAAILAATYSGGLSALAGSSINVALKTSFSSAPYLVELLETAAEENATAYYPILDRIAEGYFSNAKSSRDLYEQFLQLLKDDSHISDPATLSSFKLALSLHSAAPRIEAQYQFYHTAIEPVLNGEDDSSCPTWVQLGGAQYCSPKLEMAHGKYKGNHQPEALPFDRIIGNISAPASVLYADITSGTFSAFHKTLVRTARDGKTSYRVRHRRPLSPDSSKPLVIGGYGVELQLKRTDYIVIDDRDKSSGGDKDESQKAATLEDEEVADLKPLSKSQLSSLDLKASSFVLQSPDPFQALIRLTQDFPKYSSSMVAHNQSIKFVEEHVSNALQGLPMGLNAMWINGLQIVERQIDAFSLLDILRNERNLIKGIQAIGLDGPQAIDLLAHEAISKTLSNNERERYDWTDIEEGGKVILWLNDIERDKRYEGWPASLNALLQRTYPGQLPACRRDIMNVVLPIDLSQPDDVGLIIEQVRGFVQRKLPIRFGFVPVVGTEAALEQAKLVYYLKETYGIGVVLGYLETALSGKKLATVAKPVFEASVLGKPLRKEKEQRSFEDILSSDYYSERAGASQRWVTRLAVKGKTLSFFVNGAAIPRDENWLQSFSSQLNTDLPALQQAVFEERVDSNSWIPNFYLQNSLTRRNTLIVPEDNSDLLVLNMNELQNDHPTIFPRIPTVTAAAQAPKSDWALMAVVADLSTPQGQELLASAKQFQDLNPGIELALVDNSPTTEGIVELFAYMKDRNYEALEDFDDFAGLVDNGRIVIRSKEKRETYFREAIQYFEDTQAFVKALGLQAGQQGLLLNGRVIGPIPESSPFVLADFEQLLKYERMHRISPALTAMEALGLSEKITNAFESAKVSSIVAVSTISDVPEGIFEQSSAARISKFDIWKSYHTAIELGDLSNAVIRITVSVDPASEIAQRWLSILKVLSELEGVYLKIFLNPRDNLSELPVKRFYRYVLDSQPSFEDDGSLRNHGATFNGVPQEALLNLGLDVPAPWLVAPKESVQDLDNIKLSAVSGDVNAVYELEHILIEGHSREMPSGAPPRGAQLVLGTNRNSHSADTIIMANVGYFQFKANPGYYSINLQEGRSSQIFEIDSLGATGWAAVPGDEAHNIALMSFQGATLYPRISRKPGQETEDVLQAESNSTMSKVSQGFKQAQNMLGLGKTKQSQVKHADINIFSVASGHLYERMLNIMMVSVTKHTKHTVKFWFIEQFLSPSFKDFIPHLAAEYGFKYEMVTYKWPHWLRHQTEKQREIWGYKILFLDVLFPLSLDKVIFVDADQIVRTDMMELVNHDLKGAPYGFTPMCDSRTEMEGFRFWKQGYWKNFLKGLPYHISALYVVDLKKFRQIAAGDRLRQQYHQLSADPGSLSNLDQDLPNHMQSVLPIHSLPQEWLWCETWCSDESLGAAKTIDLCNNPQTKEPKLDRARRQVPEWTVYDDEIAAVDRKRKGLPDKVAEAKNPKSRNHEEL